MSKFLGQAWTAPIEPFSREWMLNWIGFGMPIIQGAMFRGFNRAAAPDRLDCAVWATTIPEPYALVAATATQLAIAKIALTGMKNRDASEIVDTIRGYLEAYYTSPAEGDGALMTKQLAEFALKVKRREILKPVPKSAVEEKKE